MGRRTELPEACVCSGGGGFQRWRGPRQKQQGEDAPSTTLSVSFSVSKHFLPSNSTLNFFRVCQPQKKTRHELEQEKKAAEKALVEREAQLMDPSLRPQDSAAFERLLLGSPNSSLLWLQYMAHHLQATQIEQARAVAERALKTISFR